MDAVGKLQKLGDPRLFHLAEALNVGQSLGPADRGTQRDRYHVSKPVEFCTLREDR